MRMLLALGGNAIVGPQESVRADHQIAAVEAAAADIAALVLHGHEVVLTHGNGPQVGNILAKNDISSYVLSPVPLDWCVANTQGSIGFILLDELDRALERVGCPTRSTVVLTRTLVDGDDRAFLEPTKPIGRVVDHQTAERLSGFGQTLTETDRGWRRVVPSPEPLEIVDAPAIDALLGAGFLVVAGGGGGIPVVRDVDGGLRGVEAVVDKDRSSVLLARQANADVLVLATNVDNVWVDWGRPDARALGEVTCAQLREFQAQGHFADGSMGPKVESALRFVESGGERAIITSMHTIPDALAGHAGTVIVR